MKRHPRSQCFTSSYLSLCSSLQLYVNEALLNASDVDTVKGVIHGLTSVLEIRLNRCDKERFRIVMVRAIPTTFPLLHCDYRAFSQVTVGVSGAVKDEQCVKRIFPSPPPAPKGNLSRLLPPIEKDMRGRSTTCGASPSIIPSPGAAQLFCSYTKRRATFNTHLLSPAVECAQEVYVQSAVPGREATRDWVQRHLQDYHHCP